MRKPTSLLLAGVILALPGVARADAKGEEIMAKVEKKTNAFKDLAISITMTVHNPGKAAVVKFSTITRPGGQRLINLLYPGDVKGMNLLVQSLDEMYIYLPAFRKVRRIAGHVKNQGFMGSGFTYDDMAIGKYQAYYTATFLRETPTHYYVELAAKPGKEPPYYRQKWAVRKDIMHIEDAQYLNLRGQHTKTQKFLDYRCRTDNSSHCNPQTIKMIEHTRNNLVSEMKQSSAVYDKGYSDRLFTVRSLMKSGD